MQSINQLTQVWKDLIGIGFGSVALALSLYNWRKARRKELEDRQLLYSGERQEALVLMATEIAFLEKDRAKLDEIMSDAEDLALTDVVTEVRAFVKHVEDQKNVINELSKGFSRFPSKSASHVDVVALRDGALTKLRIFKIQREIGDVGFEIFATEARRTITLQAALRAARVQ